VHQTDPNKHWDHCDFKIKKKKKHQTLSQSLSKLSEMQGYSSSVPSIAFVQVLLSDFQSDEPKHQKVQLAMAPVDLYQDELIYTLTAPSIDPSSREAENVKILIQKSKNPGLQWHLQVADLCKS